MVKLTLQARRGFTLIELLVVVVIIGILASVAMPSFVGAQDRARNAKAVSSLNIIRIGLESYAAENKGNFPDNADFVTATGLLAHLPGNKLPLSPWSSLPQTTRIMGSIPPVYLAEDFSDNTRARPKPGSPFVPATAGSVGSPPSLQTHFGAFASDCDDAGDRTRYIVHVIGKKGKNCVVAGSVNNFGL
jgi:type II secretion system protein G